jgi:hypothetical protein
VHRRSISQLGQTAQDFKVRVKGCVLSSQWNRKRGQSAIMGRLFECARQMIAWMTHPFEYGGCTAPAIVHWVDSGTLGAETWVILSTKMTKNTRTKRLICRAWPILI